MIVTANLAHEGDLQAGLLMQAVAPGCHLFHALTACGQQVPEHPWALSQGGRP
jgi:hypothetical protein